MRTLITGSTGLIGTALTASLRADGHEVIRLVRREASGPDEVRWDPGTGLDEATLGRCGPVDAVVNLAGAGLGDRRWTPAYKREVRASRINSTRTLVSSLTGWSHPPAVMVSASAIGIYGDTGDRHIDEDSPVGDSFLAQLCRDWEAAASPAREAGVRVVHPRTGLVLAPRGGAVGRLLPLFRWGLGGVLGSGRQYWSWISLLDEVRALRFAIDCAELSGPVNLTGPQPVTNAEFTRALGRVLHRPTFVPAPAIALRAVIGEFADAVLTGQRVLPGRLLAAGFEFRHPSVDAALRWVTRAGQPGDATRTAE